MGGKMQVGLSSAVILLLSKPLAAYRYIIQAGVRDIEIRTYADASNSTPMPVGAGHGHQDSKGDLQHNSKEF
eukprot:s3790_g3.t1